MSGSIWSTGVSVKRPKVPESDVSLTIRDRSPAKALVGVSGIGCPLSVTASGQ
jgi:hypothetical protein